MHRLSSKKTHTKEASCYRKCRQKMISETRLLARRFRHDCFKRRINKRVWHIALRESKQNLSRSTASLACPEPVEGLGRRVLRTRPNNEQCLKLGSGCGVSGIDQNNARHFLLNRILAKNK
jgi:hypothetical protein